jgi:hypothetical protein
VLEYVFPNGHRPPVTLPMGCVATRIGDIHIVDSLFSYFDQDELFKVLLQDIADDHVRGLESFEQSFHANEKLGCDARGFAVVSAVEHCTNKCLPILLRWAHAVNSLSILCSHPDYYGDEDWHLPVFEHALRIAVDNCSQGVEEGALDTLHILLNAPLRPYPLSANQKVRVLRYAFESNDELCVNALFHRFPDCISKVDHMRFDKPGAESLRRRCIYRLLYEPPVGK